MLYLVSIHVEPRNDFLFNDMNVFTKLHVTAKITHSCVVVQLTYLYSDNVLKLLSDDYIL